MIPSTIEAATVILLVIAPGYLAIHAWYRAKTWQGFGGDLDTVLRCLAASMLVQVPMFPLAVWAGIYPDVAHPGKHAAALFVWLLATVLLVPLAGGYLAGTLYGYFFLPDEMGKPATFWAYLWQRLRGIEPPTAWDDAFLYRVPAGSALVIEFTDGSKVAGSWEYPGTAKTSPNTPGLFLPEEWALDEDGNLSHLVPASHGLLIPDARTIRQIRILKWDAGISDELEPQSDRQ